MKAGDRLIALILLVLFNTRFGVIAAAGEPPPPITVEQVTARAGGDYSPALEGQSIRIRAQITARPVWVVDSLLMPVADASCYGLVLQGSEREFAGLAPGDWIEAVGTVARRGGMPMLAPRSLQRIGQGPLPAIPKRTLAEIASFRYQGLPAEITAPVTGVAANSGGKLLLLRDQGVSVSVFLPNPPHSPGYDLSHVHTGDRVKVIGFATQYDLEPPYDRNFEILAGTPSAIQVVENGPVAPPWMATVIGIMVALAGGAFWLKERRAQRLRRVTRAFHQLSEQIIAAPSPAAIAEKLSATLPEVIRATSVSLYIYNAGAKSLELVATEASPQPMMAPIDSPPDGMASVAVVCFRNHTVLNVPDVRRNPLVKAVSTAGLPRSAIFLPLHTGSEALGVLEIDNDSRVGYFSQEDQAAAQHLANQVAASIRLQAQQAMREQLFRSEKLAATGQLISGVAGELKAPLERIQHLAGLLAGQGPENPILRELRAESRRAETIVSRLATFSAARGSQSNPGGDGPAAADVNAVLAGLMQFREAEWKEAGIRVSTRTTNEPTVVAASRGYIEQVFLNLLVHAQQRTIEGPVKSISVQSSVIGGKVLVDLSYSVSSAVSVVPDGPLPPAQASAMGLGGCQAIVAALGGEVRFRNLAGLERFEVELPAAGFAEIGHAPAPARRRETPSGPTRQLTLMLVDADVTAQRQMVAFLASRGHRVVPTIAAEAPELASRLRFDAVFWAIRTGNGRWSEYHERLRNTINAFVLLSDGYDQNLARSLEANGGFLLSMPVREAEAERVLAEIAMRATPSAR